MCNSKLVGCVCAACASADRVQHVQGNVDANVARQSELLAVINKNTAAYRQAFGFREWRQACEVSTPMTLFPRLLIDSHCLVCSTKFNNSQW